MTLIEPERILRDKRRLGESENDNPNDDEIKIEDQEPPLEVLKKSYSKKFRRNNTSEERIVNIRTP